jgi:hypothetical protein
LDFEMMIPTRRPSHVDIVNSVVEKLLCEGVDLKTVTLKEFKERLRETICWMTKNLSSSTAASHSTESHSTTSAI